MNDHHQTIADIDDLLRSIQQGKVLHDMWGEPDLDRLRLESDLIELRTRCRHRECSLAQAQEQVQDQLSARCRRISARPPTRRRHRLLDERLLKFAYVRPWYRDLLLIA